MKITVDLIKDLAARYDLTIKPDLTVSGNSVCPLGACLVDKVGLLAATEIINNGDMAAPILAKHLGISEQWASDFMSGFDNSADAVDARYTDAYDLGQEMRKELWEGSR